MMPKKTKAMCSGCRDDYYNEREGCWSFKRAKVVKRIRVGTWEPPPYDKERAQACLSCFNPDGSSMLQLDDCRVADNIAEWNQKHAR